MSCGDRTRWCFSALSLFILTGSCTGTSPTTRTEPSFLVTTSTPIQSNNDDDDYYNYYDYYEYYDYDNSGDFDPYDPCEGWKDGLRDDIFLETAYNTEAAYLTCPHYDCWDFHTTTWFKDGVRFKWKNTDLIKQIGDKGEKLDFRKVYRDDAGNYTCEMSNGTHTYTAWIRFSTRDHPTPTAPLMRPIHPQTAYRRPGDNVTFLCQANFGVVGPAHFPQLYWTFNNTFVRRRQQHEEEREEKDGSLSMNNTLSLTHLKDGDFGQYICIAHTTFGWAQENATLINGDEPVTTKNHYYAHPAAITCPLLLLVMVALLVMVYRLCHLEINLLWKDYFAQFEDDDYKVSKATREDYTFDLDQLQGTHFSFEVRASQDVRIALSNQQAPIPDMFEIVIGGEWNTRSLVRKHSSPLMMVATHDILSMDEWRRFWVTFMNGTLEVGRQGELQPFLFWRDPDLSKVKFVGYSSGSGDKVKLKFADLGTKNHDVMILYDQAQLGFVLNTLRVFLEDTCNLVVAMEDLDFEIGRDIAENWVDFVQKARHCLIVLSQDFLRNQWLQFGFSVALDRMLTRDSRITIIQYETIKEMDDFSDWKALRHTMNAVKCIKWSDKDAQNQAGRFWKELRLQMPKKRVPSTIHRRRTTCTSGDSSSSQETLRSTLSEPNIYDVIVIESETVGSDVGRSRGRSGKIDVIPEHEETGFDNYAFTELPEKVAPRPLPRNESNPSYLSHISDNVFFPVGYEVTYL